MDNSAKALARGTLVRVMTSHGENLGTAFFNPHTLIALRMLERNPRIAVDAAWCAGRLRTALALRERLYPGGFYRLIHAEAEVLFLSMPPEMMDMLRKGRDLSAQKPE
jgi:23S rRNA (cytosine1962-C5)-methyltransferase